MMEELRNLRSFHLIFIPEPKIVPLEELPEFCFDEWSENRLVLKFTDSTVLFSAFLPREVDLNHIQISTVESCCISIRIPYTNTFDDTATFTNTCTSMSPETLSTIRCR